MDDRSLEYAEIKSVKFSTFATEDVLKLSVKEITTSSSFDALGHPLPGGLYDPVFGPISDRSGPCETCRKHYHQCTGHFGHIKLPVPVFQQMYFRELTRILKATCFSCYTIIIPKLVKRAFIIQMKLLYAGRLTDAQELAETVDILLGGNSEDKLLEGNSEDKLLDGNSEDKLLEGNSEDKLLEGNSKDKAEDTLTLFSQFAETAAKHDSQIIITKNTESLRDQFIENLIKRVNVSKKCPYCSAEKNGLKCKYGRIMIFSEGSERNMMPDEIRGILRSLWINDKDFLLNFMPSINDSPNEFPTDLFFFEVILVPPPIVRPAKFIDGKIIEDPQTRIYEKIFENSRVLKSVILVLKEDGDVSILPEEIIPFYERTWGETAIEKMNNIWVELQTSVNCIISNADIPGIKEIFEKKRGIIRQNMMGKRVNYSARSVITPDPCLNTDEIGIPEALAKILTYPVPVTSYNASMLKQMILNGPNVHPGAVEFESEDGTRRRIPLDRKARESIAKRLLLEESTSRSRIKGVKTVHRHIMNGDVVYVNRQPTLHKPSIMAHIARIQKGDKTLRLHYANCKAYNADFDGDEMNIHVPQSELARSEALNIANVCKQYTVPKDGAPLSGLIQDHVISAVRLSIRGRFFNRKDYHNLVYAGLVYKTRPIHFLPPAILKPKFLWSGKQVISTVIMNTIPSDERFLNLVSKAKLGAKEWIQETPREWLAGGTPFSNPSTMSEAEVIIRNGELLCGVIDKQQIGSTPYCLIHCIFELYGGKVQSDLLSAFSRLFTSYQQIDGFTLGVRDILVKNTANRERRQHIKKLRKIGNEVISKTLGIDKKFSENELKTEMEQAYASDPKFRAQVDRQYKESLDKYTNSINKACIPNGLLCTFPENNLQFMVTSGAKGSIVNCMQISCLLGQIELEGKRPPLTVSGRSLPSFPPYDTSPRAGGFIDGRFMTGIKPQELFFHSMAGREGLIDTAVKTSRSGYLQRCLIKHLEGLSIRYDRTVRDSDDSVVQFYYGEDGMDISKAKFLDKKYIHFLNENSGVILKSDVKDRLENMTDGKIKKSVAEHLAVIEQWRNKYGSLTKQSRKNAFTDFSCKVRAAVKKNVENSKVLIKKTGRSKLDATIIKTWRNMSASEKKKFSFEQTRCPDPVTSIYRPDSCLGVLNERLQSLVSQYCENENNNIDCDNVKDMFNVMATTMLSEPGEPVGTLAAESIGEPSTQMTLNTFHFAGRGEMNVTLGIPRLKEIFNVSSKMKTPSIEIPFKSDLSTKKTDHITKMFCRVTIADLLEKIDVKFKLEYCPQRQQSYTLKFFFLPQEMCKDNFGIKSKLILKYMEKYYFPRMFEQIRKAANVKSSEVTVEEKTKKKTRNSEEDEDENRCVNAQLEDSSDDEVEGAEEDAKIQHKMADKDFEEPEKNEENLEDFAEEMQESGVEAENENDSICASENNVLRQIKYIKNYTYDTKKLRWCSLCFVLPFSFKQIDLSDVLKTSAHAAVVREIPDIKRAISYKNDDGSKMMLRTDGVNMREFFSKYTRFFDMNKLYCNDVREIAKTYGIEAARRAIVKEIRDVFKVYGIDVDLRHLLLVADYMTFDGTIQPCTRTGMKNNTSCLQQMTFESTMQFLKFATLNAKQDTLSSPSACLMVGKPILMGTGSFDLMQTNIALN